MSVSAELHAALEVVRNISPEVYAKLSSEAPPSSDAEWTAEAKAEAKVCAQVALEEVSKTSPNVFAKLSSDATPPTADTTWSAEAKAAQQQILDVSDFRKQVTEAIRVLKRHGADHNSLKPEFGPPIIIYKVEGGVVNRRELLKYDTKANKWEVLDPESIAALCGGLSADDCLAELNASEHMILTLDPLSSSQALRPLEDLLQELRGELGPRRFSKKEGIHIQDLLKELMSWLNSTFAANDEDFAALQNIGDQSLKLYYIFEKSTKLQNRPGRNRILYEDQRIEKAQEIINDVMNRASRFRNHGQGQEFIKRVIDLFTYHQETFLQKVLQFDAKAKTAITERQAQLDRLEIQERLYLQSVCFRQWKINFSMSQAAKQQSEAMMRICIALQELTSSKRKSDEAEQKVKDLEREQQQLQSDDENLRFFHTEFVHQTNSLKIAENELVAYQMLQDWVHRARSRLIEYVQSVIKTFMCQHLQDAKLVQDLIGKLIIAIDNESNKFLEMTHATTRRIDEVEDQIAVCEVVAATRDRRLKELEQEEADHRLELEGLEQNFVHSFVRKVDTDKLRRKWNKHIPVNFDEITGNETVTDNMYEVSYPDTIPGNESLLGAAPAVTFCVEQRSINEIYFTGALRKIIWDEWALELEQRFTEIDTSVAGQPAITNQPTKEKPVGDARTSTIEQQEKFVDGLRVRGVPVPS